MSRMLAEKSLVFKSTENFEVDMNGMSRDEKIAKMNSFAVHDCYQVSFKGDFIHLLDKFSVRKGVWLAE